VQNDFELAFQRFSYRKDFDYLSYLETQSHFDRLQTRVDDGFRQQIISNKELAKDNIEAISALSGAVSAGFEDLSLKLDGVKESIDNVAWICSEGFAQLSLGLNRLGSHLESIETLTKNPTRVWAYEQFRTAKEAYLRNNFSEALASVNLALNGHGSNLGYRLDHRFYLLRGLIQLGNNKNYDPLIVNLESAASDFIVAASNAESAGAIAQSSGSGGGSSWIKDPETFVEYAADDYKIDQARALGLAGWACYCNGNFESAKTHLFKCVETFSEDWRGRYDLAKVCIRSGDRPTALDQMKALLAAQPKYALRAGGDPDFLEDHPSTLMGAIESVRHAAIQNLKERRGNYAELLTPKRLSLSAKHGVQLKDGLGPFFERLETSPETVNLVELILLRDRAPTQLRAISDQLTAAARSIRDRAKDIKQTEGGSAVESAAFGGSVAYFATIGLFVAGYVISLLAGSSDRFSMILGLVFTPLIGFGIAISIAPIVAALFGSVFGGGAAIKNALEKNERAARAESLLQEAKELDV